MWLVASGVVNTEQTRVRTTDDVSTENKVQENNTTEGAVTSLSAVDVMMPLVLSIAKFAFLKV